MGFTSREQVSESIRWKDREATRLSNGVVELIALTCGGHLAVFRFLEEDGPLSQNVFWEAPWATLDSTERSAASLPPIYGAAEARNFLAGYTGHSLCMDYFGGPSAEQAEAGLSLHGEAPNMRWSVLQSAGAGKGLAKWNVMLPSARLAFERGIRLGTGESVAYVRETVSNESGAEHAFDWVQHVTFGPPLLKEGESTLFASGSRAITWPIDYDGGSMLANNREFMWPNAPLRSEQGFADL